MSLLKATREMGSEVHFCAPARLHMAPLAAFEEMGVKAHALGAINSSLVDECVAGIQPDLVIFDRFITEEMFGWRVRNVCPDAAHVIDTQDLHFLRHARQHLVEEQIVASDPNLWDAQYYQSLLQSTGETNFAMSSSASASATSPQTATLSTTNPLSASFTKPSVYIPGASIPSRINNPYNPSVSASSSSTTSSSTSSATSTEASLYGAAQGSPYQQASQSIGSSPPPAAASLITDVDYYKRVIQQYGPLLDQTAKPLDSLVDHAKKVNVLQMAKRYPVIHANMMVRPSTRFFLPSSLNIGNFETENRH